MQPQRPERPGLRRQQQQQGTGVDYHEVADGQDDLYGGKDDIYGIKDDIYGGKDNIYGGKDDHFLPQDTGGTSLGPYQSWALVHDKKNLIFDGCFIK